MTLPKAPIQSKWLSPNWSCREQQTYHESNQKIRQTSLLKLDQPSFTITSNQRRTVEETNNLMVNLMVKRAFKSPAMDDINLPPSIRTIWTSS